MGGQPLGFGNGGDAAGHAGQGVGVERDGVDVAQEVVDPEAAGEPSPTEAGALWPRKTAPA